MKNTKIDSRDAAVFWTPAPIPGLGFERALEALGHTETIGQVFVGQVFSKVDWARGKEFIFRDGAARDKDAWVRLGPGGRQLALRQLMFRIVDDDNVPSEAAMAEFGKIQGWP